jgi:hypothetical protein
VSYIGHTFTSKGIKPDKEKVQAILLMPEPNTKQELQRFIGMIQYLAKFIADLSEKSAPTAILVEKERGVEAPKSLRTVEERLQQTTNIAFLRRVKASKNFS